MSYCQLLTEMQLGSRLLLATSQAQTARGYLKSFNRCAYGKNSKLLTKVVKIKLPGYVHIGSARWKKSKIKIHAELKTTKVKNLKTQKNAPFNLGNVSSRN